MRYLSTGKIATVNEILEGLASYQYRITLDGEIRTVSERFLGAVQDTEEDLLGDFIIGKLGDHSDYEIFDTWYRLSKPLTNNLYSYLGSKTLFNPYQFRPLLRFLSSNSDERLFIADEVGVGKTIETGIIIKELIARGRLDIRSPILIVCPYSLGPKWVKEMKERFDLGFHLHDGGSLGHMLRTANLEGVYPQRYTMSVVGLQLLRRADYLGLLKQINDKRNEPIFKLVVVDEAHHMRNSETDSYELGTTLSEMSEMMLMLSATPLNLKNEDLFNQMHILNPSAFPDFTTFETLQSPAVRLNRIRKLMKSKEVGASALILQELAELSREPLGKVISDHPAVQRFMARLQMKSDLSPSEVAEYERLFVSLVPLYQSFTRTRKREALEHQIVREVHELPVTLSVEERSFHDDLLDTIRRYYLSKGLEPSAVGLIMNTHRRMVSSCLPAMLKYLQWTITENRITQDEELGDEEAEDDAQLDTEALDPILKESFLSLLDRSEKIQLQDSKYAQFKEALRKILQSPETPQVIVFSFFIRTLDYLKERLEKDGFSVGLIHGEIPLNTEDGITGRYEIMDEFKKGTYQVLLSSEVGGEGLDFQYCHAVMNYDMPYNPMRIEQRIGRIDRFGQAADKIVIVNLFLEATVDEEIYDRLYRRIRIVEDGVGALEPILGKELSDLQTAIIAGNLTKTQMEEIQRRIQERVAAAKLEMEEFEKYRNELLGDDYLTEQIKGIPKSDFVSPSDCVRLTEQFVSRHDGCKFDKMGESKGEITLTPAVLVRVEQFLRRPGNEGGYLELKALVTQRPPVKVVFDGNLAEGLREFQFLSPTGSWPRFLVDELQTEGAIKRNFAFKVSSDSILARGTYIVFFFELRLNGIRSELQITGIPVDTESGKVCNADFDKLPRTLVTAKSGPATIKSSRPDPNPYLRAARDRLGEIVDEKLAATYEDNRYRVETAIAALEKSASVRKKKLQEQMDNHLINRSKERRSPDDTYLRLTEAKIHREDAVLLSRTGELRKHQDLSIDYCLQSIVYLEVA